MTKDREQLALTSIATALSQLAHERTTSDDGEIDELVSLGLIVRELPCLCSHHIEVLKDLVYVLHDLQHPEAHEHGEEIAVQ
jgi:hypothetical protein